MACEANAVGFLAERYAVEPGHHHVAEHDVEALRFLLDQFQRLLRVESKHGLIAEIVQQLRGEFADLRVVLHHQDTAARL